MGQIFNADGIKFPAAQSASSDANTLDDYEEGTWTPVLKFGGATTGITYGTQVGTYTKIGNRVFAEAFIDLTNKGSAVGDVSITGLPFTVASEAAICLFMGTIAFGGQCQGFAGAGGTQILLYSTSEAGIGTAINNGDFSNPSNIRISLTYKT